MKRITYVEANETHSPRHELARRTLGYSAGQAGFFKHALSRAFSVDFISMDAFHRAPERVFAKSDAIIFSSKSGIRKIDFDEATRLLRIGSIPICCLVQQDQPRFMIEDRFADFCSVIFKREPLSDLEVYDLSEKNRRKIVPTVLANPLSPLFNRAPWLTMGKRPPRFGFETEKRHDAFFIGRVGKNRYENRIEAWAQLADSPDIRPVGGIIPGDPGYDVPANYVAKPMGSKSYRDHILTSRVNLALDGIGPFTFRHLELFWCGAFCLSETNLGQIWLREPIVADRDYVWFDSWDDMVDKARFYIEHDNARERIARNGRDFYDRLYDPDAHAREIEAAIFGKP